MKNLRIQIEVHKVDFGGTVTYELTVNGITIGQSKNQFDADHAKIMLEKALERGTETWPLT